MTQKSLLLHWICCFLRFFYMTAMHNQNYFFIKKNWLHTFSKIVLWLRNLDIWPFFVYAKYLPNQLISSAPAKTLGWWLYNSKNSILNWSASLFERSTSRFLFSIFCNGTKILFFVYHNGNKISIISFFLLLAR